MKVFVARATGALGKQLVPMLVANGHEVVGMTRTEAKRDQLRSVGAQPVVADALDADAVGRAVGAAEPDVIVHQLTAIPPAVNMRRLDREFALTNRLRVKGTDHLLSAGKTLESAAAPRKVPTRPEFVITTTWSSVLEPRV